MMTLSVYEHTWESINLGGKISEVGDEVMPLNVLLL